MAREIPISVRWPFHSGLQTCTRCRSGKKAIPFAYLSSGIRFGEPREIITHSKSRCNRQLKMTDRYSDSSATLSYAGDNGTQNLLGSRFLRPFRGIGGLQPSDPGRIGARIGERIGANFPTYGKPKSDDIAKANSGPIFGEFTRWAVVFAVAILYGVPFGTLISNGIYVNDVVAITGHPLTDVWFAYEMEVVAFAAVAILLYMFRSCTGAGKDWLYWLLFSTAWIAGNFTLLYVYTDYTGFAFAITMLRGFGAGGLAFLGNEIYQGYFTTEDAPDNAQWSNRALAMLIVNLAPVVYMIGYIFFATYVPFPVGAGNFFYVNTRSLTFFGLFLIYVPTFMIILIAEKPNPSMRDTPKSIKEQLTETPGFNFLVVIGLTGVALFFMGFFKAFVIMVPQLASVVPPPTFNNVTNVTTVYNTTNPNTVQAILGGGAAMNTFILSVLAWMRPQHIQKYLNLNILGLVATSWGWFGVINVLGYEFQAFFIGFFDWGTLIGIQQVFGTLNNYTNAPSWTKWVTMNYMIGFAMFIGLMVSALVTHFVWSNANVASINYLTAGCFTGAMVCFFVMTVSLEKWYPYREKTSSKMMCCGS
jgi:hypothetical protein